jgi:hypothetical protein
LTPAYDAVLTQDAGNTLAKADVVVYGVTLLKGVPVTYLLYLEKQATDLATFIEKLPTTDPSETWIADAGIDGYATAPYETLRMAKVYKTHISHPPTDKHPAQVQTYTVDEPVGTWVNIKKSGAISLQDRNRLVARVAALKEAIRVARESANGIEVDQKKAGESVLGFLFGDLVAK